jgi:hypothetical protein
MLIIHGAYHFWPKRVAFRNDYCFACKRVRRAVAIRTFDVGHIFWIPILPVGFWKHWRCANCGSEPHATGRFGAWFWLLVFGFLSVACWLGTPTPDVVDWGARIVLPLVTAFFLLRLVRALKRPSLREGLSTVEPATDVVCPFCSTPLIVGTRWSCPACGVVRY